MGDGSSDDRRAKKGSRLRPDLPGGRKPKGQKDDPDPDEGAMAGRSDDRKHRPAKGTGIRKRRGRGDQGAWQ